MPGTLEQQNTAASSLNLSCPIINFEEAITRAQLDHASPAELLRSCKELAALEFDLWLRNMRSGITHQPLSLTTLRTQDRTVISLHLPVLIRRFADTVEECRHDLQRDIEGAFYSAVVVLLCDELKDIAKEIRDEHMPRTRRESRTRASGSGGGFWSLRPSLNRRQLSRGLVTDNGAESPPPPYSG